MLLLLLLGISGIKYSFGNNIPAVRLLFAYPLCGISNVLLVYCGLRAWKRNKKVAPRSMQNLLLFIILWGLILIVRSIEPAPDRIRDLFFTNWGAMSFLFPLLACFGLRVEFWTFFSQYGLLFLKIGIVCGFFNILFFLTGQAGTFPILPTVLFLAPLFFLYGFSSSKYLIKLGTVGLIVWCIIAFFNDTREDLALILYYFSCASLEMWRSRFFSIREKIPFVFVIGFVILLYVLTGFQFLHSVVETNSVETRVELFFNQGGMARNTRAGLIEDFFKYRTIEDNIIGGGAVTSYHTDITRIAQSHLGNNRRSHIEVGHLYHMLTGGIILNILFNLTAFGAIFLGIFRSNNRFTRVLAYLIAGWVMMMFTAATPFGGMRYALVWLAIGGCMSKELRAITTLEFIEQFRYHALRPRRKIIIKW